MKQVYLLFTSLNNKERAILAIAIVLLIISGTFISIHIIDEYTVKEPAFGGTYIEGIVGQPSFVNPILAKNNTPDKDLTKLLFANLITLSKSIKHSDDYKIWNVRLKENAKWHDGTPITSDDIIFTIHLIQNPNFLSPLYSDWKNIEVERVSEIEIKFTLTNSYSLFRSLLKELMPIPKKIFADLSPTTFRLSIYNLEPIGSGPFKFVSLNKQSDGFINEYNLSSSNTYSLISKRPYIKYFKILFFKNNKSLINAYNKGEINSFYTPDSNAIKKIILKSKINNIGTTKYFAVFFNKYSNPIFDSINLRKALSISINKKKIIDDVFSGFAIKEDGPITPTLKFYNKDVENINEYDPKLAINLIKKDGWTFDEKSKIFTKRDKKETINLTFTLKVPDINELKNMAKLIKQDWKSIGVNVNLDFIDPTIIDNEVIKTRNYEALLFGNILSNTPSMFSFWDSSEQFWPGLNLSMYSNKKIDSLIMDLRNQDPNNEKYFNTLNKIQEIISKDYPAVFLISPINFYITRNIIPEIKIQTISNPSDRFTNVEKWYIKTKRHFK